MVSGDDNGLGISGADTPPALQAIVTAPYALPSPSDCVVVAHEIADLDELLGPDVDAPPPAKADLEHSAGQAFGSAVRGAIPYRWVLRWMTQAGRLDRELRQAILAGTARRGFLKGIQRGRACPPPQTMAAR
jgi:predicted methyltransferase MtxX (methanogen marker protein 4)